DRRIERESGKSGAEQDDADQAQAAVRHPMKKPEQSETFQRPAEGDPFAMELEWENQTNEKQKRPALPGEPRVTGRGNGLIKFQQRDQADRGRNREGRREQPHPVAREGGRDDAVKQPELKRLGERADRP